MLLARKKTILCTLPALQLVIALVLSHCANEPYENHPILGLWSWIESTGWPQPLSPARAGYRKTIAFDADGRFRAFKNDSLIRSTDFKITMENFFGDQRAVPVLQIDDDPARFAISFPAADTLLLQENCDDCLDRHMYARQ